MRLVLLWILLTLPLAAIAGVKSQAGPYRIDLQSNPSVIPVGQASLFLKVTDQAGKPVDGLQIKTLARMPGMSMGEREQLARPLSGSPGTYSAPAIFAMAGAYELSLEVEGTLGKAATVLTVNTGQDLGGSGGGFRIQSLLPWIAGVMLLAYVIVKMRRSGQGLSLKSLFAVSSLSGLAILAVLLVGAIYVVNTKRRQGSMTPLEAQVMEMNTPAPPGSSAVELASVEEGTISESVKYSGQAVGFIEQDVNPRVSGVIVWMPLYVGDRVKRGQLIARLDTSQWDPQLAEKAAMAQEAGQGVAVAATEYQTALQEVSQARAELGSRLGMVEEAEAMLSASREERSAMEAELAAMRTDVSAAEAELTAANQNAQFRADEHQRNKELLASGAISRSELQLSEAENSDTQSKALQAKAMVRQAQARVNAAQANVRKADAMIVAAQKRIRQAKADVRAAQAAIRTKQSAAEGAKQNIGKERAGAASARAGYAGSAVQRGYAQIKAEVDGIVTQRLISPGVYVAAGQSILKIAQTNPIRLQANVASSDLARIRVGSKVSIVDPTGKRPEIVSSVSSVSPALDPNSRTGVVEILWPNIDNRFRPGEFVELRISVSEPAHSMIVPKEAIQVPAGEPGQSKPFVWVADGGATSGNFTVRKVLIQKGATDGRRTAVSGEVKVGEQVVVRGGEYLRDGGEVSAKATIQPKGPVVEITTKGFSPSELIVEKGKPVTITFIRRTDQSCGTEVIFPELKIDKPLPLNVPVEVTFTPQREGELQFACGMDMLKGKVIVR